MNHCEKELFLHEICFGYKQYNLNNTTRGVYQRCIQSFKRVVWNLIPNHFTANNYKLIFRFFYLYYNALSTWRRSPSLTAQCFHFSYSRLNKTHTRHNVRTEKACQLKLIFPYYLGQRQVSRRRLPQWFLLHRFFQIVAFCRIQNAF